MAAASHGVRQLRQSIWHWPAKSSVHKVPAQSIAQRIVAETRSLLSRFTPSAIPPRPSRIPQPQTIGARFSLPVKHALGRPFSPPRLPRPPTVPTNVTHVGLGTARAFHSGRPIFQNMVDNVPIATRALWEAEWDIKMKKKEARRIRRAPQNKVVHKSQEMLRPKQKPALPEPPLNASELDVYFPVESTPAVTTHLLVPLAPTPTATLPLSTRTADDAHPLLPISNLAAIHRRHRLHSLRVSTLFARLDTVNVWDDPRVNVDAYAFGPRHDAQEKQCTVLRVTFRGWDIDRVRAILGDSVEEWYTLEETPPNGRPTSLPHVDLTRGMESASLESVPVGLDPTPQADINDDKGHCPISPLPVRASASAQHDLVLPTLDFSTSSDAPINMPQPAMSFRTASATTLDTCLMSLPMVTSPPAITSLGPLEDSWECLGLSSSFLHRVGESRQNVLS